MASLASQSGPASNHSLRVLCAEDDWQLADTIRSALERAGHRAELVVDGHEALQRIISDPDRFQVIITDHRMPNQTGLGFVAKLRDTSYKGAVVVFTAELSPAEEEAYEKLAVDAILRKPLDSHSLLKVVSSIAPRG